MNDARHELAASAARLIAEDGLDYGTAKRKAVHALFGAQAKIPSDLMPSNEEVEQALREYQALFQSDSQPQRLHHLRTLAVELMTLLAEFNPWLAGAVWNGTAGEHSPIRLELYTESGKEVAIFLLNQGFDFETDSSPHFSGRGEVETLKLFWKQEEALLYIYSQNDLRAAQKTSQTAKRGNGLAVKALLGTK